MLIYILSKTGKPLMPTKRAGKVRRMLKDGKAKVVKRCPFTIKLTYDTTEYTQSLILGVDTGSGTIGTAVSKENGEIVYISNVIVRNDIKEKLDTRRKYRRTRRNRKTRYRKARFLNRKNSIKNDRFSPTMISKFHSHIREIEFIKKILPITKIVLETASFDTHLLKNPLLYNEKYRKWGYQQGTNYGFENTKAMVLNRDNYTCQICKGKHKDKKLEVHHIIFRKDGGSDDEKNLITLCHTCHYNLHHNLIDEKILKKLNGKKKGQLKYATQMNSIRIQLLKKYPNAVETFGYITKLNRLNLNLNKDHYIDACIIATQGNPILFKVNQIFIKKCVAKGDYQQTKGIRSEQRINTGKILGFRKFDKVKYFGKTYFIKGRMSSGYAILMDIYGKKVDFSNLGKGLKTPKLKNLQRISARKSVLINQFALYPTT